MVTRGWSSTTLYNIVIIIIVSTSILSFVSSYNVSQSRCIFYAGLGQTGASSSVGAKLTLGGVIPQQSFISFQNQLTFAATICSTLGSGSASSSGNDPNTSNANKFTGPLSVDSNSYVTLPTAFGSQTGTNTLGGNPATVSNVGPLDPGTFIICGIDAQTPLNQPSWALGIGANYPTLLISASPFYGQVQVAKPLIPTSITEFTFVGVPYILLFTQPLITGSSCLNNGDVAIPCTGKEVIAGDYIRLIKTAGTYAVNSDCTSVDKNPTDSTATQSQMLNTVPLSTGNFVVTTPINCPTCSPATTQLNAASYAVCFGTKEMLGSQYSFKLLGTFGVKQTPVLVFYRVSEQANVKVTVSTQFALNDYISFSTSYLPNAFSQCTNALSTVDSGTGSAKVAVFQDAPSGKLYFQLPSTLAYKADSGSYTTFYGCKSEANGGAVPTNNNEFRNIGSMTSNILQVVQRPTFSPAFQYFGVATTITLTNTNLVVNDVVALIQFGDCSNVITTIAGSTSTGLIKLSTFRTVGSTFTSTIQSSTTFVVNNIWTLCYATMESTTDSIFGMENSDFSASSSSYQIYTAPVITYTRWMKQTGHIVTFSGTEAVAGDFVIFVANTIVDGACVTAVTSGASATNSGKLTLDSSFQVTIPSNLAPNSIVVCYARKASTGSANANYAPLPTVVTIINDPLLQETRVATGSSTVGTFSGGAALGDQVVAQLNNCVAASTAIATVLNSGKLTLSALLGVTFPSNLSLGTYVLCYCTQQSGCTRDSDYRQIVSTVTVIAAPTVSPAESYNQAPALITGSALTSNGDFIVIKSNSCIGASGAASTTNSGPLPFNSSLKATMTTLISSGTYIICWAPKESLGTQDSAYITISAFPLKSPTVSSNNWTVKNTPRFAMSRAPALQAVQVVFTGSVTALSKVFFLANGGSSCVGSKNSATTSFSGILTVNDQLFVSLPNNLTAGSYIACFAPMGTPEQTYDDSDFMLLASTITLVQFPSFSPSNPNSYELMPTVLQLTGASLIAGDVIVLTTQIDCQFASSSPATVGYSGQLYVSAGLQVTLPASLTFGSYVACYTTSQADAYLTGSNFKLMSSVLTLRQSIGVTTTRLQISSTSIFLTGSIFVGDYVLLKQDACSVVTTCNALSAASATCSGVLTVQSITNGSGVVSYFVAPSTSTLLSVGSYNFCVSPRALVKTIDSNYSYINQMLQIIAVTGVVNTPTAGTYGCVSSGVVANAATGDFLVLQKNNCQGAQIATNNASPDSSGKIISASQLFLLPQQLQLNTFVACYATSQSGGDEQTDYTVLTPATITWNDGIYWNIRRTVRSQTGTSTIQLKFGGTAVSGVYVGLAQTNSCAGVFSNASFGKLDSAFSVLITLSSTQIAGNYYVCYGTTTVPVDDITFSVVCSGNILSTISVLALPTFSPKLATAGSSITFNGPISASGDIVVFAPASDTTCTTAPTSTLKVVLSSSLQAAIPTTQVSASSVNVCYATSQTGGSNLSDFKNIGAVQVLSTTYLTSASVVISPSTQNVVSSMTISATTSSTNSLPSNGILSIEFASGFTCQGCTTTSATALTVVGGLNMPSLSCSAIINASGVTIVTITKTGGSVIGPSTPFSLSIYSIVNSNIVGSSTSFGIYTQDASLNTLDISSGGVVTQVTINTSRSSAPASLSLNGLDISAIGSKGSSTYNTFVQTFQTSMTGQCSTLNNLQGTDFLVTSVTKGSIVVNFLIYAPSGQDSTLLVSSLSSAVSNGYITNVAGGTVKTNAGVLPSTPSSASNITISLFGIILCLVVVLSL